MNDPELHPDIPDDFDRRDDQGMWTLKQTREGAIPEPTESDEAAEDAHPTSGYSQRRRIPVHGAIQTQIADDDRKAQDIHARSEEESRLRAEGFTDEEMKGAEIARRWLEEHQ